MISDIDNMSQASRWVSSIPTKRHIGLTSVTVLEPSVNVEAETECAANSTTC